MKTPEPCWTAPCRAPIACHVWGYCRERNFLRKEDWTWPINEEFQTRSRYDATLARVDAALNEEDAS